MVESLTMALMASKALGTGLDIMDTERQKAFNAAILEGQIENFNDLITEQKLDVARKNLDIQGKGVVKAAASGVQVSGSVQTTIGQDVFDNQLEALRQIRQLKFERTMAELRGASVDSQLTGEQIGSAISGAGSIIKTAQNDAAERDLAGLKDKK